VKERKVSRYLPFMSGCGHVDFDNHVFMLVRMKYMSKKKTTNGSVSNDVNYLTNKIVA
jgi:hypothetical protein